MLFVKSKVDLSLIIRIVECIELIKNQNFNQNKK